jgi:NADH-quinone oxidoreductase E subunit
VNVEKIRFTVDQVFEKYRHYEPLKSALIPLLQDVQEEIGYLPEESLDRVAQRLELSTSQVYGVVTFYHQFRLRPKGKHLITVCRGTACHVKGAFEVNDFLEKELGINPLVDTSEDGMFTLQQVRCIGACSLAPVIKIDEEFYGNMTPSKARKVLDIYRNEEEQ